MLILLACVDSPRAVDPLESLGSDVTDVLFAAQPTEAAATLASMVWDAPAGRFDREGTALGAPGALGESVGRVAVVANDSPVRVVIAEHDVRLLVWLEDDALAEAVPESMWLDGGGHRVHGLGAGVRVLAGSPVEPVEGTPMVSFEGTVADVAVPIASDLVDTVWTPDDGHEARALQDRLEHPTDTAVLSGGTVFRDDGGRELFRLRPSPCAVALGEVLARDEARGLLVLVALGDRDGASAHPIFARGWIEEPDETLSCFSSRGSSMSSHCGIGLVYAPVPRLWLPPGALLFDAPDGGVTGVTERFVQLDLGEDAGAMPGWEPVLAPSPWGREVVWVRAEGDDTEIAEAARAEEEAESDAISEWLDALASGEAPSAALPIRGVEDIVVREEDRFASGDPPQLE